MELRTLDAGGTIHYADFGGEGGRTLVLVHGLGGSHANWAAAAPGLTRLGRVVAPDLGGFGRTPWRPGQATVDANHALLGRFVHAIAPGPVVLVGNSMGGLISMLLAASDPGKIEALVLVGPGLLPAPIGSHDPAITAYFGVVATPIVGELVNRHHRRTVPPDQEVNQMLKLCGVEPRKMSPEVLRMMHELARERAAQRWTVTAYLEAARSILMRLVWMRWLTERSMTRVQAPTLLLQGLEDRLVLPVMSRRAIERCPHWRYEELPGIGHIPMLQAPELFNERVSSWLNGLRR